MNNVFYNRNLVESIKKWINRPEIIVIIGPRQVGKTFLTRKILPNITEKKIEYFNFEDFELRNLFIQNPKKFLDNSLDVNKIIIFDEFQKVPEITSLLKTKYDKDKNNLPKIFLTGSSSVQIQKKVSQSLVGQSIVFNLFSLSFLEKYQYENFNFLNDKIIENISQAQTNIFFKEDEIKRDFEEYVLFGGYPELGELKVEQKWEKLKSVISLIIEKDMQSLVKEEHLFYSKKILEILSHRLSSPISFDNIASEVGLNIKTVKNICAVLEGLYFIKFIYPKSFYGNEYKKAPKAYFLDQGIRNEVIKNNILPSDTSFLGGIIENFIFNQLSRYVAYKKDFKLSFWQDYNQNEIDFILERNEKIISIEVKYQQGQKDRVGAGIRNFIKKYKPEYHITATKDYWGEKEVEKTKVYFIPAYVFGLLV